ncbi:MAG: transposase [Chitinophagaceae bacterium]|nr:transposase [Chitinophagaceae bacterium]
MNFKKSKAGRKPVYDQAFKNTICLEVINGNLSLAEAKAMYAIKGAGTIYRWIKEFTKHAENNNLDLINTTNPVANQKAQTSNDEKAQDLIKKNEGLQAALELAKLKITALEVMIDVAESELNIDIRKKSGTKQ